MLNNEIPRPSLTGYIIMTSSSKVNRFMPFESYLTTKEAYLSAKFQSQSLRGKRKDKATSVTIVKNDTSFIYE